MTRLALLLLLLFSFFLPGPAQAAAPPLPIDEYWQRVEELRALVRRLEEGEGQEEYPELLTAAEEWAGVTAVLLPDGTVVPVDPGRLEGLLRASPPDIQKLGEELDVLLAARATWARSKHTTADLRALAEVLSRPEFQWQQEKEPSPVAEWFRRLGEKIDEFLRRLFRSSAAPGVSLWPRYLLTGLGIVLLSTVLYYVLRSLLANMAAETALAPEAEAGDEGLDATGALKRAETLAAAQDYRTAVRYLYLSALLLLEEHGLLRYNRSLTNREYLQSLAQRPELAGILRDVVDVFERVWYGFQPLDETAYAYYETRINELSRQR